jgi:hypothetical protein
MSVLFQPFAAFLMAFFEKSLKRVAYAGENCQANIAKIIEKASLLFDDIHAQRKRDNRVPGVV